jgi:dihydrofolate synthase / folylpolyglutamate synthase
VNYPDSVHFLYALGNEIKTAKLGLERIGAVLDALGRPQDRCRIVHVAGTNGKGSICAMLESGLRAAGLRTGLFTSPHLMEPTERIRINGEPVSAAAFAAAFDRVHEAVERLLEAGSIDLHTTYFETVTAMAFLIFAEAGVDVVALEVGLGGRLDATNVARPELCVIAPIDFDHERYLGSSLEAIAAEKAGILKPGAPAVFSRQRAEVRPVLEARAREVGVAVTWTADLDVSGIEVDARGSRFGFSVEQASWPGGALWARASLRPRPGGGDAAVAGQEACSTNLHIRCPLAGEHQVENAVTAAAALLRLGIPALAIERGIAAARWPGRLERVSERPEIILDGAHNPAGARALAAYIGRFYGGRNVRLIYGAMRDKAVAEMGGILFPHAREVIVTAPREARAMAPETLIGIAEHANARVAANIEEALAAVSGAAEEDVIFITGSLFLVAEARAILTRGHLL